MLDSLKTYAEFIGQGPAHLGTLPIDAPFNSHEERMEAARRVAPDGTMVVHFHQSYSAVVEGEELKGKVQNRTDEGFILNHSA